MRQRFILVPTTTTKTRRIADAYKLHVRSCAKDKISRNVHLHHQFYRQEAKIRARYIRKLAKRARSRLNHSDPPDHTPRSPPLPSPPPAPSDNDSCETESVDISPVSAQNIAIVSDTESVSAPFSLETPPTPERPLSHDAALHSLQYICDTSPSFRRTTTVIMPNCPMLPRYDMWVPVMYDYFVKDGDVEAFVPYFGDSKKKRRMARKVYLQMLRDMPSCVNDVSDGEINTSGERFTQSKDDSFYDFQNRIRREIERFAILRVVHRFPQSTVMWKSLCVAFGKPSVRAVQLIYRIAQSRQGQLTEAKQRRKRIKHQTTCMKRAILNPHARESIPSARNSDHGINAMRYFCFTCHIFSCQLHEDMNVQPVIPIPDKSRDDRLDSIRAGKTVPCSSVCFLKGSLGAPADLCEGTAWTDDELALLREARKIFGDDACSVGSIIGSKTCREVFKRMNRRVTIDVTGKRTSLMVDSRMGRDMTVQLSDIDDERTTNLPTGRLREIDNHAMDEASKNTKTRFIPCRHMGACTKRNGCRCVMNDICCESTCGCNNARFGEYGQRMGWLGCYDTDGWPIMCTNRHKGCRCGKHSTCSSDACECYRNQRACNPDFCESCDGHILPENVTISDRRCRNVDIIACRHKKVLVGRSKIHGYGLFAGQMFRRGELLGPYCGRVMGTKVLDAVLRTSQAKKSTYAFNLTHDLTVDAGDVGCKVKFINHSFARESINCLARVERVRGECRIGIKAIETIRPGQELLMDYEIDAEEGNNWFKNSDDDDDDDENEEEDEKTEEEDEETEEEDEDSASGDGYNGVVNLDDEVAEIIDDDQDVEIVSTRYRRSRGTRGNGHGQHGRKRHGEPR